MKIVQCFDGTIEPFIKYCVVLFDIVWLAFNFVWLLFKLTLLVVIGVEIVFKIADWSNWLLKVSIPSSVSHLTISLKKINKLKKKLTN